MQTLKKEIWKNFKSDGLLFEELVGDILKIKYPKHTFQRTPHTHDGARDFECSLPMLSGASAQIWIECKYHQERLPVNAVAMTMVMAILDQSKQIIFFSYSPIKRTFIDYTARFQHQTGIDVKIYDDCTLEALILGCWNKLDTKKYFNIDSRPSTPEKLCAVDVHMDVVKVGYCGVAATETRSARTKDCFYLNDTAEVRFSFRNTSASQGLRVHLGIEPEDGNAFFDILNRDFRRQRGCTFDLPCGAVFQFCLPLKLIRYREKVSLPQFTVCWEDKIKKIPRKTIHTRWIAETPLIGQAYYDAVDEAEKFLRASSQLAWIKVSGRSGVGKSRLLRELCSLQNSYFDHMLFINAESRQWSFQEVTQTLVSELTNLPLQKDRQLFSIQTDETEMAGNAYAAKILYDPSFSFSDNRKDLAYFTGKLLAQKRFLLVVDNAQNCDALTLQYLNALLERSGDCPSTSAVFVCFNEDQLFPGTEAWTLSHCLSALAAQEPKAYLDLAVKGFSEQEAMHYLNECLNWPELEQINIPETLRLLVQQCGTEPLYLQNMLLYLAQEHILERTETAAFYVSDPAAFHRAIRTLPKTLNALLLKREELLRSQLPSNKKKSYLDGMWLTAAFPHLPVALFRDITEDPDLMEELLALGLLQENGDGTVSFRHQLLLKYFRTHYPLRNASTELLNEIKECIEKRGLERELAQGLFLVEDILGEIEPNFQKTVIEQIESGHLDHLYSRDLIPVLFKHIQKETIAPSELLSLYRKGCFGIAHYFGLEEGLPSFELACKDILERRSFFSSAVEAACAILREYENGLLNFGQHERAEKLLGQTEDFLNGASPSDSALFRTKTSFAISSCVTYNALGLFNKGKCAAEKGVEMSENAGNLRHLIQSHMEYGYLYYYSENAINYIPQICEQWKTAYDLWETQYLPGHEGENPATDHMANAVLMTAMLGDLADGKIELAEMKAQKIQKFLNHTGMPFYEAKLRLALCCYELMSRYHAPAPLDNGQELIDMLHQSLDKCIAYCLTRDYPACYYLLAVVHLIDGKTQWAMDNYLKAVATAQKYIKTSRQARQWKYLFYDIAYRLRIQGIQREKLFDEIEDPDVRKKCLDIFATTDEAIAELEIPRLSPLFLMPGINLPKV